MNFFKKEVKKRSLELPDLPNSPELPELPELPEERETIPPLPTFPKTQIGNNMGLQAIKSTVSGENDSPGYMIDDSEEEKRTIELSELPTAYKNEIKNFTLEKEPIFVKLEKFKEAVEKFEQIKDKVMEIEETLKKLKNVKEKEDAELKSWEIEVISIKEKVENIDNSLFKKI